MAKKNEHLDRLTKMREQQMEERRTVALGYDDSNDPVAIEKVVAHQNIIDALDRAIECEKKAPTGPISLKGVV